MNPKYTELDLIRYGNFRIENPDVKPFQALKLFKLKYKTISDQEFVKRFYGLLKDWKRRYQEINLGKHIRLSFHRRNCDLRIGHSFEKSEGQPHIIIFTILYFSLEITW